MKRTAMTLIELLVVIAIIGTLVGLLLPAVQAIRESARKMSCQNQLKQIGLALTNYHAAFNQLPLGCLRPDGYVDNGRDRPFGTWAIAVLPMLEQGQLFEKFESKKNLNQSENELFRTSRVPTFECPSDFGTSTTFQSLLGVHYSRSSYAANYGSGSWGKKYWDLMVYRGVMGQNAGLKYAGVKDGLSQTVCVAEIRAHPDTTDNRGVWAFHAAGSSLVGLDCDQTCRGINDDPQSDWIPFCSVSSSSFPCNFQNNSDSNAGPRSLHRGGANLLLCDGAVRFVSDAIDLATLVGAFTSGHHEVISGL